MSVLYSVLMNAEKSEYWYARLQEYAANAKDGDRSKANAQVAYLDIVLSAQRLARNLAAHSENGVSHCRAAAATFSGPVSLTNNQPSLMNGGKDFCEWSKNGSVPGQNAGACGGDECWAKRAVGLVQTALGESAYAKGEDRFVGAQPSYQGAESKRK
ncbi:MAG: hypothetical protein ACLUE8_06940 [Lachnospiraceae bacterium]